MSYHHGDLARTAAQTAYTHCLQAPHDQLSVREIAASLGVTPRAIYRHHKDRDGLLKAACARAFFTLSQHIASLESPTLIDVFALYVDFAIASPTRYKLMFGLAHGALRTEPIWTEVRHLIHLTEGAFERTHPALENRVRRDAIMRRWGLVHGLVELYLNGSIRARSPQEAKRYIVQQLRQDL